MKPHRSLVGALAAVLAAACSAPDRPPEPPAELPAEPPPELPAAATAMLSPDTARVRRLAQGVWYRYLWSASGPWALHLVEVDLGRCAIGLDIAVAEDAEGSPGGHERVSSMAARRGKGVIAAVNGDFFTPEGLPLGPESGSRGVRSRRARPGLVYRPGSADPWIGTVLLDGDSVLGMDVPLLAGGVATRILGGFPELLDDGARPDDLGVAARPSFAASRHPRTAVGVDPEADRLWLVVVDGRQGEYSTGMSLPELADLFAALGATEALNLDGGGSSVLVLRGRAVSRTSDEAGERPVVNALLVVEDESLCGLSALPW